MPTWNSNGERDIDWDAADLRNGRDVYAHARREWQQVCDEAEADKFNQQIEPYHAAAQRKVEAVGAPSQAEQDRAYWQQLQQQAAAGSREAQIAVAFAAHGRQGLLNELGRDINQSVDKSFDAKSAERILKQGSFAAAFKTARDLGRAADREQAQRRARPTTMSRSMQDAFAEAAGEHGYRPRGY